MNRSFRVPKRSFENGNGVRVGENEGRRRRTAGDEGDECADTRAFIGP